MVPRYRLSGLLILGRDCNPFWIIFLLAFLLSSGAAPTISSTLQISTRPRQRVRRARFVSGLRLVALCIDDSMRRRDEETIDSFSTDVFWFTEWRQPEVTISALQSMRMRWRVWHKSHGLSEEAVLRSCCSLRQYLIPKWWLMVGVRESRMSALKLPNHCYTSCVCPKNYCIVQGVTPEIIHKERVFREMKIFSGRSKNPYFFLFSVGTCILFFTRPLTGSTRKDKSHLSIERWAMKQGTIHSSVLYTCIHPLMLPSAPFTHPSSRKTLRLLFVIHDTFLTPTLPRSFVRCPLKRHGVKRRRVLKGSCFSTGEQSAGLMAGRQHV